MLKDAFNAVCKMHSREVTLKRIGTPDLTTSCRVTPSNYSRNLEGPSHTVIHGREFIIPIDSIQSKFSPVIKRADRIIDAELGQLTIDEVQEMYDFGGSIMAYRVRVE